MELTVFYDIEFMRAFGAPFSVGDTVEWYVSSESDGEYYDITPDCSCSGSVTCDRRLRGTVASIRIPGQPVWAPDASDPTKRVLAGMTWQSIPTTQGYTPGEGFVVGSTECEFF